MGNTTRREPVSFRIPASPDYKFFNVTDFRGLEMTDNPFIASNNTASDLLNVYVDENNALTTRPRLEKLYDIHNNIENFKEVLFSYKLLDRIVFQILLVDGSVKLYYKKDNNLILIDNITNNIIIPDTKMAVFEKDDKIYIMTGVLYCVMKEDNILYNVENDVDTHIPTIGISTIDDSGIRTLVNLEQKNILNSKYRIDYYWDTKTNMQEFIGENGKIVKNGYVNREQYITHYNPDIIKRNYIYKLLDDESVLFYDRQTNEGYFIREGVVSEKFSITVAPVLYVSSNGKWFLCGERGTSTLFVVDENNNIKESVEVTSEYTINSDDVNHYYLSSTGDYLFAVLYGGSAGKWGLFLNSKILLTNENSNHNMSYVSLYVNDNMRNAVIFSYAPNLYNDNLCIVYDIYSENTTHKWFSWEALHYFYSSEGAYPSQRLDPPAIITNDCSFVFRYTDNKLMWGTMIDSSNFSYNFKQMDFVNAQDKITRAYLSSDRKLVYILCSKYTAWYDGANDIYDVWCYSFEKDSYYKLITLDKRPEGNTIFDKSLSDFVLGASEDLKSLYILTDYGDTGAFNRDMNTISSFIFKYSITPSIEPLLTVEYDESKNAQETENAIDSSILNIVLPDYSSHVIDLSDYKNIYNVAIKFNKGIKDTYVAITPTNDYTLVSSHLQEPDIPEGEPARWYGIMYKLTESFLEIKLATEEELGFGPNLLLGESINIAINIKENKSIEQTSVNISHNKLLRFQNNYWFYGNGNTIRWTGNNDPTYLPEYNYTTLGDTADDVNDILLVSKDVAIAFKQNNFYVINPVTVSDTDTTYTFVEAKSDIGVIAPQSSIISPLKETPLYVNAKGIYGLELLKNVQSSDNVSVLYSENVNKKYLKELNKFHIMSTSRLYWVLFIIPGKTSKVYVYDDRNSSWYYWELPINTAGCWSDDDTVYFVSKDGRVCNLKTNDIVDTKYSIETEYYDDGRKLIPWFWKSQILPLGTMNYSKKLINTTFILTDTDENEEYGLEYKFKAYRKIVSETNATRVSNRLTYIQSTTKKTTIPRFNFLQIELNNIEDDLNNNKLRLIGLGLKYELLEGLS